MVVFLPRDVAGIGKLEEKMNVENVTKVAGGAGRTQGKTSRCRGSKRPASSAWVTR